MGSVQRVDMSALVIDISRDLTAKHRVRKPGPPERIDGMTVGVATIEPGQSPHDGEKHPDGDEVLYVVSGMLRVTYDSGNKPMDLSPGEACVVERDEWHKVDCLETTTFIHITPGPNGDARPNPKR